MSDFAINKFFGNEIYEILINLITKIGMVEEKEQEKFKTLINAVMEQQNKRKNSEEWGMS